MTSSEIADTMSEQDARLVTGHIRNLIAMVTEKVDEIGKLLSSAYDRRAWVALGYESWDAYVSAELRTDRLRLDRDDRQDLVVQLRSAGMSTRAIGAAVGVGKSTVDRDLDGSVPSGTDDQPETVRSLDGRERPTTQPPRARHLPSEDDQVGADQAPHDAGAPSGQTPGAQEELPDGAARPVEGEGAPAPSVAPNDGVSDFLDSDTDLQRERYLHEFIKVLNRSDDFMQFDAEKVGDLADADVARTLDDYLTNVKTFVDRFHRARRGLQVINGGKA